MLGQNFVRKCLRVKPSNDNTTRGIYSLASDTSLLLYCSCLDSKGLGQWLTVLQQISPSTPVKVPYFPSQLSSLHNFDTQIMWISLMQSFRFASYPSIDLPYVVQASVRCNSIQVVPGFWLINASKKRKSLDSQPPYQDHQCWFTLLQMLSIPQSAGLWRPRLRTWYSRTCRPAHADISKAGSASQPHYSKIIYGNRSFTQHRDSARLTSRM